MLGRHHCSFKLDQIPMMHLTWGCVPFQCHSHRSLHESVHGSGGLCSEMENATSSRVTKTPWQKPVLHQHCHTATAWHEVHEGAVPDGSFLVRTWPVLCWEFCRIWGKGRICHMCSATTFQQDAIPDGPIQVIFVVKEQPCGVGTPP